MFFVLLCDFRIAWFLVRGVLLYWSPRDFLHAVVSLLRSGFPLLLNSPRVELVVDVDDASYGIGFTELRESWFGMLVEVVVHYKIFIYY